MLRCATFNSGSFYLLNSKIVYDYFAYINHFYNFFKRRKRLFFFWLAVLIKKNLLSFLLQADNYKKKYVFFNAVTVANNCSIKQRHAAIFRLHCHLQTEGLGPQPSCDSHQSTRSIMVALNVS